MTGVTTQQLIFLIILGNGLEHLTDRVLVCVCKVAWYLFIESSGNCLLNSSIPDSLVAFAAA